MRFNPIFFLLFFLSCSSKSLIGTYTTYCPPQLVCFTSEKWDFNNDGSFSYQFNSDNLSENSFGTGTFRKKGNTIILEFSDIDTTFAESSATVSILNRAKEDSLKLEFVIMEMESKTPLPYANITVNKSGQSTDTFGKSTFTIPSLESLDIQVSYIGYKTWEKNVELKESSKIVVLLAGDLHGKAIENRERVLSFKQKGRTLYFNNNKVVKVQ